MRLKNIQTTVFLLLMMAMPAMALSEGKPQINLEISALKMFKVIDDDGVEKEEWKAVETINPGDVLKYLIRYTNAGDAVAKGATIVDPVPEGVTYIANSADNDNAEVTYSVDGKTFHLPTLLVYRVARPDGIEVEMKATPEMYRHIKWKILKAVPPGESGEVSFKVKVK